MERGERGWCAVGCSYMRYRESFILLWIILSVDISSFQRIYCICCAILIIVWDVNNVLGIQ